MNEWKFQQWLMEERFGSQIARQIILNLRILSKIPTRNLGRYGGPLMYNRRAFCMFRLHTYLTVDEICYLVQALDIPSPKYHGHGLEHADVKGLIGDAFRYTCLNSPDCPAKPYLKPIKKGETESV